MSKVAVIHQSELEDLIASGTTLFDDLADPSFGGLIPVEYSRWGKFFGCSWRQFLYSGEIDASNLRNVYFAFCLRLRYEFERCFDRCLYEPLDEKEFKAVWSEYSKLCNAAVDGIDDFEWKAFRDLDVEVGAISEIQQAVSNIKGRCDIADKFSSGATDLRRFGKLNRWGQLVSDGSVGFSGDSGHFWRLFVWVTQVIAMKMQLASNELQHELESWTPAAKRHAESLGRSRHAIEGWLCCLSSVVGNTANQPSFQPLLMTLNSTNEYLKSLIAKLREKSGPAIPVGVANWSEYFSTLVGDANLVCGGVLDELFQRQCFAAMHSLNADPPVYQVYCYQGGSQKDLIVAHCLNFDLVAAGSDIRSAVEQLSRLLRNVLAHVSQTNSANLPVAPARFFRSYKDLRFQKTLTLEFDSNQFDIRCSEQDSVLAVNDAPSITRSRP